jgi:hypothetical protein
MKGPGVTALREQCASVPPSTLLAALLVVAAVLWPWHAWQTRIHRVRMPVGRTESVITTQGSFSARLPAGLKVAGGGTITDAIGLLVIEGVATREDTAQHTPVRVHAVDDRFWTFHERDGEAPGAGTAVITDAVASALGAETGGRLRLRVSVPSDVPRPSVLAAGLDAQPIDVRIAAVRPVGAGDSVTAGVEPEAPRTVYVSLSWMQRQLELAGRINTVLLRFSADARRDDGAPPPDDVIMRAWLAAAALPDHGVRIRRVPGDNVMALDALGGLFDPALATRVMTALSRAGRPAVPALSSVGVTLRAGDRVVTSSTITAIDPDAYLALSLPSGPARPGDGSTGTDDALLRSALQVNVGRRGVRVGRVQVTDLTPARPSPRAPRPRTSGARVPATPAPDGAVWLNEWAAADLQVTTGDQVQLSWPVWQDERGLTRRHGTFDVAGTVPMMRIGGDRSLLPDLPVLSAVDSPRAWPAAWRDPDAPVRPEDEAYWRQWNTAPRVLLPLERGQQLLSASPGALSSIRFALGDADLVAAAVRDAVTVRVRLRHPGLEAAARLRADLPSLLRTSAPVWLLAVLLVTWLGLALQCPGAIQTRRAAIFSIHGLTRREIADDRLRRARAPVVLATVAATAIGAAGLLESGRPIHTIDVLVVSLAAMLSGGVLWLVVLAEAQRAGSSGELPLAFGVPNARDARRGRDTRRARWLRAGLAGAMVVTGAWGAWPTTARVRTDAIAPDQLVVLRVEVPRAMALTPSGRDARAALGLDEHPAWDRAVVAPILIRDASVPVFGVPTSLATALGLEAMPTDGVGAWPTRWARWLGVSAPSQPQSLDPRDAEALVATTGAVPEAAAVLPPGLLVTEATFVRAFPLHEGPRAWCIVAPRADADTIAAALRERLGVHGVVIRPPQALPEGWRVR